jgi:hypothetical protein
MPLSREAHAFPRLRGASSPTTKLLDLHPGATRLMIRVVIGVGRGLDMAGGKKSKVVKAKVQSKVGKQATIRKATGRVATRGGASLSKGVRSR